MANVDTTNIHTVTVTAREIQSLADRLYSRGVSVITTCDPRCQSDLIQASRVMRALLSRYERANGGRQLEALMIGG